MALPKEDLSGMIVKTWKVSNYIKKGNWLCTCTICGRQSNFRAFHLKQHRVRECTHSDVDKVHTYKTDIQDRIFGKLHVERFDEIAGKWICKCSCGNITLHTTYELTKQYKGVKSCGHCGVHKNKVFTELTAKEYIGNGYWKCECSCGNIVKVRTGDLTSGNTRSCGHLRYQSYKKRVLDIQGMQFGEWTVEEYVGHSNWRCRCSCGTIRNVHSYSLRSGVSTCCGGPQHRYIDMYNKQFGELLVKEYTGNGGWLCECSCGNTKVILGTNLRNGSTSSCGCITDNLLRRTLYSRYGDICPSKASQPRDEVQLSTINNKYLMKQMIESYRHKNKKKPDLYYLADQLGVTVATVRRKVKEYELTDDVEVYHNRSKLEQDLLDIVKDLLDDDSIEVIHSDKTELDGKELDIYIPTKKLAIEFNGSYWHSTQFKDSDYHQNKTLECLEKGIRLIHIFEYEWMDEDKQRKIINLLSNILCDEPIYSYTENDTIIKEINEEEYTNFCNMYHLEGYTQASIKLGCISKSSGETLGVMGINSTGPDSYEIVRQCWKEDTLVIGGLENLINYFVGLYEPVSIITYIDIAKNNEQEYLDLGFKKNKLTAPSYKWLDVKDRTIFDNTEITRDKLIEIGVGNEEQTEDEIMEELDFIKVCDCGRLKLQWTE